MKRRTLFASLIILLSIGIIRVAPLTYIAEASGETFTLDVGDEVVFLDLTTQKGGIGIGEPSPPFTLGEMVELRARLTYNDIPQKGSLVGFEVLDPNNETTLVRTITDHEGIATTEFRIPALPKSWGTWKAFAVSKVQDITGWDFLYFTVQPPVGGHVAPIEKTSLPASQVGLYPFILIAIVMLIAVFKKMRARKTDQRRAQYKNHKTEIVTPLSHLIVTKH